MTRKYKWEADPPSDFIKAVGGDPKYAKAEFFFGGKKLSWASGDPGEFLRDIGADPEGTVGVLESLQKEIEAMKAREGGTTKSELYPPGPWQTDDDHFDGFDPATGLSYHVRRMMSPYQGHLCGYVESPYHTELVMSEDLYDWCDVHGGVTFCDVVPEFGADKVFVGFDCAHSFDVMPGMPSDTFMPGAAYRDMNYVTVECLKLAKQLARQRPVNYRVTLGGAGLDWAKDAEKKQ